MLRDLQHLHLTLEKRRGLSQAEEPAPGAALYHDPDVISGQAQDLLDIGDRTDLVEVLQTGLLHGKVPLGNQKNGQALCHGMIQGLDGGPPAHVKVEQHIGEDGQAPEGQYRHGGDGIGFWRHVITSLW